MHVSYPRCYSKNIHIMTAKQIFKCFWSMAGGWYKCYVSASEIKVVNFLKQVDRKK